MRFTVSEEARFFAESVRAALGDWEPAREPELGAWQDDRDDALGERLAAAGWGELWSSADLRPAAVAGGIELGRAVAPVCLVDEATLGAPLAVGGRARHARAARALAVPLAGGGLALGGPGSEARPEPTLDGTGTVRVEVTALSELERVAAAACWRAWSAATLGYLAGLAERALELATEHAGTREQFGAPLGSLPAVQGRLADAALAVDATRLLAWATEEEARNPAAAALVHASAACRDVTGTVLQVHGAMGFALESGLHRFHRRACSLEAWTSAACAAAR